MAATDELRESVRRSFPELAEISDETLRDKVVEAWAFALSETEFTAIEQIRASGNPTTPAMKVGTQVEHLRGVARIALAMADSLQQVVGSLHIDRDLLCAAALCHDLGKPFEFSPANQARWQADPRKVGYPSVRHPGVRRVRGAHGGTAGSSGAHGRRALRRGRKRGAQPGEHHRPPGRPRVLDNPAARGSPGGRVAGRAVKWLSPRQPALGATGRGTIYRAPTVSVTLSEAFRLRTASGRRVLAKTFRLLYS